eukprot:TRINITY_DN4990_c0_g1_i15.p2 TRINITY_DN4990_c0_g1~~TRINITY_DN4990_c0_g1_i15.p2  ORF type:complete len:105 (+),score=9.11 TRINITY_DN4990_c0_g1_i15:204-518(+)
MLVKLSTAKPSRPAVTPKEGFFNLHTGSEPDIMATMPVGTMSKRFARLNAGQAGVHLLFFFQIYHFGGCKQTRAMKNALPSVKFTAWITLHAKDRKESKKKEND